MNKEFGSTLCDKLSHMVREGGKAAAGGYTGEVINESPPCAACTGTGADDLMKRGAVMICAGTDLRLFYAVCTVM